MKKISSGDRKFVLILIEGNWYFRKEKSEECPMPHVFAQTYEVKKTPQFLKEELQRLERGENGRLFFFSSPCWTNCDLSCPAKQQLDNSLSTTK